MELDNFVLQNIALELTRVLILCFIVKRLGLGMGMGNDQVDSDNNNLGKSNMIKEKVINNP